VATEPVTFNGCRISANGCTFQNVLQLSIAALPGVQFEFKRGYVGVDAIVRGKRYRFVNTHLEIKEPQPGNPLSMFFQSAQAAELIAAIHALPEDGRKLILVGDTNSAPTNTSPAPGIVPPYQQFAAAGYLDAWTSSRGTAAGFTCCQAADLRNKHSELFERIDQILVGTPPLFVRKIKRLGENPADRTIALPHRPALWPSDHAGLAAVLQF
jgi:endonuclease/exonuclease/phosphatase family metal-dependent hydrolase